VGARSSKYNGLQHAHDCIALIALRYADLTGKLVRGLEIKVDSQFIQGAYNGQHGFHANHSLD